MDNPIYLLVADRSAARIFAMDAKMETLELVAEHVNPAGRKLPSELESDRPGRIGNSTGHLHAFGNEYTGEEHDSMRFAKQLCELLDKDHQEGKFRELMIAAPPHFLGDLRHCLGAGSSKVLSLTLDKDLLHASGADIRAHCKSGKASLRRRRTEL